MKERPIIFSGAMVEAILAGRKTQTRRVIKLNGTEEVIDGMLWRPDRYGDWYPIEDYCPYHNYTRLWVRETWRKGITDSGLAVEYAADLNRTYLDDYPDQSTDWYWLDDMPWRPSIFMPRWASRITLEIVSVRAERVQDISERDAMSEGVNVSHYYCEEPTAELDGIHRCDPVGKFAELWDSLNASRGYSWESNPWVWVISFRKLEAAK